MPQLITCLVNTNIPNYDSYLIITPTYILSYYFINNMYKTEIKEFRKNWSHEQFNKVMKEWNLIDKNSLKQDCDTQDQTEKPTMEK